MYFPVHDNKSDLNLNFGYWKADIECGWCILHFLDIVSFFQQIKPFVPSFLISLPVSLKMKLAHFSGTCSSSEEKWWCETLAPPWRLCTTHTRTIHGIVIIIAQSSTSGGGGTTTTHTLRRFIDAIKLKVFPLAEKGSFLHPVSVSNMSPWRWSWYSYVLSNFSK